MAESFAHIFFRNNVGTEDLYPCEITERLCDTLRTGDVVTVDWDNGAATVKASSKVFPFKPPGGGGRRHFQLRATDWNDRETKVSQV